MGIKQQSLYISTVAPDACHTAARFGLGLELAEYCTAANMDAPAFADCDKAVRRRMCAAARHILHAPFNELCPAAIDPLARELAKKRLQQAAALACHYGIRRMVVHSGYIPTVYHPDWFTARSEEFWRELLETLPRDFMLCLENVMEPGPALLAELARRVDDPRFRLCLDIGHANAALSETPPPAWVDEYAPFLSHVHLHDNEGDYDLHAPLGTGTAPLEETLGRLLTQCPGVTWTVESTESAPALEWLDKNGFLEV